MRWNGFAVGAGLALVLAVLPVTGFGQDDEPALHDCGERKCEEWKPKGDKTCRVCKTPQCKKVPGGEALAGTKTETECYEGHGPPPEE